MGDQRHVFELSRNFRHPASSAIVIQLEQLRCSHVVILARQRRVPRDGDGVADVRRPACASEVE